VRSLGVLFFCSLFFGFLSADSNCTKCSLNKDEMRCNYYVAKMGDSTKSKFCENYASYLSRTKVYGKAAWYYLLSKKPKEAIENAKKAVEMGENYAYEFIADAYLIEGKLEEAEKNYKEFKKKVGNTKFFTSKNFKVLKKLYKNFDSKKAEGFLK